MKLVEDWEIGERGTVTGRPCPGAALLLGPAWTLALSRDTIWLVSRLCVSASSRLAVERAGGKAESCL